MRILVTGAGGFIGSHLVDKCKRDGHYVIGLDRKWGYKWIKGIEELDEIHDGCNVVKLNGQCRFDLCYHLAAESRIQPSFQNPFSYVKSNVLGTAAVLEAARNQNAKVVYAGSSTADDNPNKNVYAMSKWQGEELCRAWRKCFGSDIGIARFYNVYGKRHISRGDYATVVGIWERQLMAGEKLTITGTGQQKRDFTAVEDIVDGLVAIAERGGNGEYSLGTGKNHSMLDVAKMFTEEDRWEFVDRPPGESEVTLADVGINEEELGWAAKRKLEDYVARFKQNHILDVMG